MDQHTTQPALDLETVLKTDREARLAANAEIEKLAKPSDLLAGHSCLTRASLQSYTRLRQPAKRVVKSKEAAYVVDPYRKEKLDDVTVIIFWRSYLSSARRLCFTSSAILSSQSSSRSASRRFPSALVRGYLARSGDILTIVFRPFRWVVT